MYYILAFLACSACFTNYIRFLGVMQLGDGVKLILSRLRFARPGAPGILHEVFEHCGISDLSWTCQKYTAIFVR